LAWLIAEDEVDIRNLIAVMCQVWGYSTLTFETGQKVWDWLDEVERGNYPGQVPELVLMDIRMPGKFGNEVANRMRKLNAFQPVPIVLMTAFSLSDTERAAMVEHDGVDHIISKPLPDFEQLRSILHGVLNKKKTAQPGAKKESQSKSS
jgi:CheY-like chemotaxis protein